MSSIQIVMTVLFAALLTLSASSSRADSRSEFLHRCQNENTADAMYCVGFIAGVFESAAPYQQLYRGDSRVVCPPKEMSNDQLRRIVISFLEQNPKNLIFLHGFSYLAPSSMRSHAFPGTTRLNYPTWADA